MYIFYIFDYNISTDGPENLSIIRDLVPAGDDQLVYNFCPGYTAMELLCVAGGVVPGANITMTSHPAGLNTTQCSDVTDRCVYTFSPNVTGDHVFNCSAVNSVFDHWRNEAQLVITVQGKSKYQASFRFLNDFVRVINHRDHVFNYYFFSALYEIVCVCPYDYSHTVQTRTLKL